MGGGTWQGMAGDQACKLQAERMGCGGGKEGGQLQQGSEGGAGAVPGVGVTQAGLGNTIPLQVLAQSKGTRTWGEGLSIVCGVRCVHLVCAV